MEIQVIRDDENPYLDRREIEIKIIHEKDATPKRFDVFKVITEKLSLNQKNTVLMKINTIRGSNTSIALIYYYPKGIDWSTIEPIKRNKVIEVGEEKPEKEG